MRVAILGCGPSGLAAAHAALVGGHEVVIFSKSQEPSTLYGCQYLHAPIPGFEDVDKIRVQYSLIGTAEEYRQKVYGSAWTGRVSPEDFVGEHDAWDIRATYAKMWSGIFRGNSIQFVHHSVRYGKLDTVRMFEPDKIFSTIPATSICRYMFPGTHQFLNHGIWATGSMEADGLKGINQVMCNGTDDMNWYRVSNVFGYRTVEWSKDPGKYVPEAVRVTKPLSTDCDCNPDVIRVGRYGEWSKGVLVHHVFEKVRTALDDS